MQADLVECRARSCEPDVSRWPPQSVIWPIFRVCCNEKKTEENEDINHFIQFHDDEFLWPNFPRTQLSTIHRWERSEMPKPRWTTIKIYLVECSVDSEVENKQARKHFFPLKHISNIRDWIGLEKTDFSRCVIFITPSAENFLSMAYLRINTLYIFLHPSWVGERANAPPVNGR